MRDSIATSSRSILAIATVFFILTTSLAVRDDYWADEGFTVRKVQASWRLLYDPFSTRSSGPSDPFDQRVVYDFDPPVYFGLARLLAGENPNKLALRMLSLLPMTATLAFAGLWARGKFGRTAGLTATLLFALSPAAIYYAEEARSYALALCVGWAGILISCRSRNKPARLFAINASAAFLGLSIHYGLGWLEIAWGGINLLATLRRLKSDKRSAPFAAAAGTLAGAVAALAVEIPAKATLRAAFLQSNPLVGPETVFKSLFLAFVPAEPSSRAILAAAALAAAWGLMLLYLLAGARRRGLPSILLVLWLGPVFMPMLAHWMIGTPFYPRYAIFSLPGWILLSGWLLREGSRRSRAQGALGAILIAAIIVYSAIWNAARLRRPLRADWSAAIAELKRRSLPTDGYAVVPEWTSQGFAANARTPPAARYESLLADPPLQEERVWIVAGSRLNEDLRKRMETAGYRIEPAVETAGHWLWLCQKK